MYPREFLFPTVMEVVPTSIIIFKGFNLIAVAVCVNGLRDFQKDRDKKIDLAPVISCSMTKI
jgi:tRNA G37 N-methylase TrmD